MRRQRRYARDTSRNRGRGGCRPRAGRAKTLRAFSRRRQARGARSRPAQKPAIRHRDRPGRDDAADRRDRRTSSAFPTRPCRPMAATRRRSSLDYVAHADGPAERQADPRHRDHPDPGRRGQDDDDGRARRRAQPYRQEGDHLPARAEPRAQLRHEGRRRRRRLCAGRADGGHQPPFHRRFPRDRRRQQPARGDGRQPHLLGQRARHRPAPRHLAPRPRHERPGAALDRLLARRRRQRLPARGRVRHRRRLRGDGDLLPRDRPRRSEAAARQHHRRPDPGARAGARRRSEGGRARWRCC